MYFIIHAKQRHFKDAISRISNIFFSYFNQSPFVIPVESRG